ncbi:hypothetical protein [Novipirellula caenicola]|uniref:Secreted protein n=1 Tax=Novipirellula caenicola TaxID=1536901 RepID=A0ABP9VT99_9BACT
MKKIRLSLLSLTACCAMVGCGEDTATVPTDRDEMQAYIDAHPELNISDEELNAEPPSEDEEE